MPRQLRPKQLRIVPIMASLVALSLLLALPSQARASSVGAPVPKPNGPSQAPASIALPAGGFAWTPVTLPYGTNGSQMAVGGAVDANSRLSVSPQGAGENGISVTMPSGTTAQGLIVSGGDFTVKNASHPASMSIAGYPDAYQYANFNLLDNTNGTPYSNPYWYFSYKSASNYGRQFQMNYYTGATFGNNYTSPLTLSTSGNLNIQGAFNAGSAINGAVFTGYSATFTNYNPSSNILSLKMASGQTADADQLLTSTGTVIERTSAAGVISAPSYSILSGGTTTPGLANVTIPTGATLHIVGGLIVGYTPSGGSLVGN